MGFYYKKVKLNSVKERIEQLVEFHFDHSIWSFEILPLLSLVYEIFVGFFLFIILWIENPPKLTMPIITIKCTTCTMNYLKQIQFWTRNQWLNNNLLKSNSLRDFGDRFLPF